MLKPPARRRSPSSEQFKRAAEHNPMVQAPARRRSASFEKPDLPPRTPSKAELRELAERDLLKAIELNSEAPFVLNYLGYSWLERGVNFQQALNFILSAAEMEPDDAYIIDSLGWAYFMLGDFKKSVDTLEHALRLIPYDPTLNDHLGDAYWKVGRKNEAIAQWKRVLIYEPKEELKESVTNKISSGL